MLILTRKKGEALLIGDEIKISVLEVDGEKVSVGIQAPRNVKVLREELILQTIDYNKESLRPKADILAQFNKLEMENH